MHGSVDLFAWTSDMAPTTLHVGGSPPEQSWSEYTNVSTLPLKLSFISASDNA